MARPRSSSGTRRNVEGEPYSFEVRREEDRGSGIGCVDADGDGRGDVVGLSYEVVGPEVRWTRTIVRVEGDQARNGPVATGVYRVPEHTAAIELLSQATCGDRVLNG